jgi:hypothetical protein
MLLERRRTVYTPHMASYDLRDCGEGFEDIECMDVTLYELQ